MDKIAIAAKIDEYVATINAHPDLEKEIYTDEKGKRWLNTNNDTGTTLGPVIEQFMYYLSAQLIDSQGQHGEMFYEMKRCGYRTETGERDSFGPLSSILTPPDRAWSISYG